MELMSVVSSLRLRSANGSLNGHRLRARASGPWREGCGGAQHEQSIEPTSLAPFIPTSPLIDWRGLNPIPVVIPAFSRSVWGCRPRRATSRMYLTAARARASHAPAGGDDFGSDRYGRIRGRWRQRSGDGAFRPLPWSASHAPTEQRHAKRRAGWSRPATRARAAPRRGPEGATGLTPPSKL